jgi:hypothetical protein
MRAHHLEMTTDDGHVQALGDVGRHPHPSEFPGDTDILEHPLGNVSTSDGHGDVVPAKENNG